MPRKKEYTISHRGNGQYDVVCLLARGRSRFVVALVAKDEATELMRLLREGVSERDAVKRAVRGE